MNGSSPAMFHERFSGGVPLTACTAGLVLPKAPSELFLVLRRRLMRYLILLHVSLVTPMPVPVATFQLQHEMTRHFETLSLTDVSGEIWSQVRVVMDFEIVFWRDRTLTFISLFFSEHGRQDMSALLIMATAIAKMHSAMATKCVQTSVAFPLEVNTQTM